MPLTASATWGRKRLIRRSVKSFSETQNTSRRPIACGFKTLIWTLTAGSFSGSRPSETAPSAACASSFSGFSVSSASGTSKSTAPDFGFSLTVRVDSIWRSEAAACNADCALNQLSCKTTIASVSTASPSSARAVLCSSCQRYKYSCSTFSRLSASSLYSFLGAVLGATSTASSDFLTNGAWVGAVLNCRA